MPRIRVGSPEKRFPQRNRIFQTPANNEYLANCERGRSHNPFSAQVTRLQEQLEEALALRTTINKRTKLVEKLCCLHLGETTGDSLTRLMRERARLVARQKVGGRRWHQPGNTLDLSHNSHLHR